MLLNIKLTAEVAGTPLKMRSFFKHKTMISINEAKDQAAQKRDYKDFEDFLELYSLDCNRHTIETITDEAMSIYAESKAKEEEWIKVTDRLPEFLEPVIVYGEGQTKLARLASARYQKDKRFEDWVDAEADYTDLYIAVTHWMPLPKNPKTT